MRTIMLVLLLGALAGSAVQAQKGTYTAPNDPALPADFVIQGEYVGETVQGDKLGCQVIALGNGAFHAVLYPGGLPGAGWDGKNRMLMDGQLDGGRAVFKPAEGPKRYLARSPQQFCATSQFPPQGHKPCKATISGDTMAGQIDNAQRLTLKKVSRKSPTLGAKPPENATVLFDGTNTNHWQGGRLDEKTNLLNTDGRDIRTKEKFNDYTMHLEFMLPYRPEARGQGRGNSGFYQVDHYEVQILDSFGLEGKNNECGGVYSKAAPLLNMCLPPLTWQTYDVEFTNARSQDGRKTANAQVTVKLNGVVIHDELEIDSRTGGSRNEPEGTPGAIKLQGHGNPLQFRNVWILRK